MNKKQALFTIAKVGFAVIVLSWLLHKVNAGVVWGIMREAQFAPIIFGTMLCWLTLFVAGWRWHRLLEVFGIDIALSSLICIAQIGQFFTVFLPGPAGDDLTRMLYISRLSKGHVGEACTTVLLDRLIGLSSILLTAVFCIPWQWRLLVASPKTHWMALGIAVAGGLVVVAGLVFFLLNGHSMRKLVEGFLSYFPPTNLVDQLKRISGRIFTSKVALVKVILAAVGTQVLLCGMFFLAGRSVGIHVPVTLWLGFVPIIIAANALPVTIAGIGVRESLMPLFLGVMAHIDTERAIAASLVVLGMTLVVCLFGGIVYIVYRPTPDEPRPPDDLNSRNVSGIIK